MNHSKAVRVCGPLFHFGVCDHAHRGHQPVRASGGPALRARRSAGVMRDGVRGDACVVCVEVGAAALDAGVGEDWPRGSGGGVIGVGAETVCACTCVWAVGCGAEVEDGALARSGAARLERRVALGTVWIRAMYCRAVAAARRRSRAGWDSSAMMRLRPSRARWSRSARACGRSAAKAATGSTDGEMADIGHPLFTQVH